MIEPDHERLSVSVQASLLGINRTSLYYKPVPHASDDIRIKECIDRIYTAHPEYGSRRISAALLRSDGLCVNRKAVQRHMREMGFQAIYPRQKASTPEPMNKVYPYLLKDVKIERPNHVWSIDITYIPIRKSWLYLVAIMDWYSRYVVSWKISDSLEIGFVLEAASAALGNAVPEIMNSDQGSHFTSPRFTELFQAAGSRISMDHRGRAYDNIFIERLWRTVKYENVYPNEYETPRDARHGIGKFMNFYNNERPHQSLDYKTPAEIYYGHSIAR